MPPVTARRARVRGRCRPFTTADAMTLVAAVAVGLAALPGGWRGLYEQGRISLHPVYYNSLLTSRLAGPFWLALTLACGVIRLREPRPPLRRLRDQPGAVACLSAAAVLPFLLAANALAYLADSPRSLATLAQLDWMPDHICPAVVAGWAVLRLGGRWRPEPGWIEALGLTLGGGWIALFAFTLAMRTLYPG